MRTTALQESQTYTRNDSCGLLLQHKLVYSQCTPQPKLPCKRARHTQGIIAADCHPSLCWYTLNTHHSWTQWNYASHQFLSHSSHAHLYCTRRVGQTRTLQQKGFSLTYGNSLQMWGARHIYDDPKYKISAKAWPAKKGIDCNFTRGPPDSPERRAWHRSIYYYG